MNNEKFKKEISMRFNYSLTMKQKVAKKNMQKQQTKIIEEEE